MQKILFVDIDSTTVRSIDGSPFTPQSNPTEVEFIPTVANVIAKDYLDVIGVSNQTIGAGNRTFEGVVAEMQMILSISPQLDYIYMCPDLDGQELWCIDRRGIERRDQFHPSLKGQFRKPNPGIIQAAIAWMEIVRGQPIEEEMDLLFVKNNSQIDEEGLIVLIPFALPQKK